MPEPTLDFAQCLKAILRDKKISASELARMMAYKSRNSIFRILDGEGAHGARLAFFERLKSENPLELSQEEVSRLAQALEISRVGVRAYCSHLAMRELLTKGETVKRRPIRVIDYRGRDGKAVIDSILSASELELTITGCCDRAIFEALRERFATRESKGRLRVTHCIYAGEVEIVRAISAIQPLLYAEFYEAYCVEPGTLSKEREQLYRSNCIFARWLDEKGAWHVRPFVLIDKDCFLAMKKGGGTDFDVTRSMFYDDRSRMTPIKTVFADTKADYVAYTEECRKLEQGRTIYTLKLDIPFPYISEDILVPCALESFRDIDDMDAQVLSELVERLRIVHTQRFENIFTKRRPTHTILSRRHMERFAMSGRQTDHFFALRPYTGAERAAILSHLRNQAAKNPFFCVYFLKEDMELPFAEIGLYEGAGALMTKPFTDYNLSGDHAEAIIAQQTFCAQYKAFFVEHLLEGHVTSREETLRILDDLIEMAKNAPNE